MASYRKMQTKSGKVYYEISVSRGHGITPYRMRWYPDNPNWSDRKVKQELDRVIAQFVADCKAKKVLTRPEQKAQAEAAAKAAAEAAAKAEAEAAKLKTVRQYADGVFMPTKEITFSENARANYRQILDSHILPKIGDVLLKDVSPAMIQKLLVDFQKAGYSHSTCVKLYNILNGLFQMAFLDDSIPFNPLLKVKRPAPRKDEAVVDESEKAYTADELRHILSCTAQEPLRWQAYILLAADTGARRGELCGLQWADIDWKARTIQIKRNLQYSPEKGVYSTSPKNKKKRVVDVGQETLALLRQYQKEQASTCISKWVFTAGTPDPMSPQTATRYFKRFGERYGIKDFHVHKLRHSFASIAITNGADVVSVSQRLGHSDTAVTLKMYAHANEESIRRAGQIARDALKAQNK